MFLLSMRTVLGSSEMTQLFFDWRVWQSHFALIVKNSNKKFKEPLNKSSAAGKLIFFPIHAEWKTGNTRSIPLFSILLSDKKSLTASSCLFIQSFLNHTFNPLLFHIPEKEGVWFGGVNLCRWGKGVRAGAAPALPGGEYAGSGKNPGPSSPHQGAG